MLEKKEYNFADTGGRCFQAAFVEVTRPTTAKTEAAATEGRRTLRLFRTRTAQKGTLNSTRKPSSPGFVPAAPPVMPLP